MSATAKLFTNGASQAVRLPKEFRFEGSEVGIKHLGGAVLLFPKNSAWDLMGQTLGKFGDDFMPDRNQPAAAEVRKPLARRRGKRS